MKTNKIGAIFLVSVLALAGIGISYAGWTDKITVTGTVQTGYVGFEVVEYSGTWVWKHYADAAGNTLHDIIEHHGAVALTDLNGDTKLNDDPDGYYDTNNPDGIADGYKLVAYSYAHNYIETANEEVKFEFVNLFPCIYFKADFKFTVGSIPIIIQDATLNWFNEKINDVPKEWIEGIDGVDKIPDVTVQIKDPNGIVVWPADPGEIVQLHPYITYTWVLTIHIPQHNAYMKAWAEATGQISIIQWSDPCEEVLGKSINIPDTGTTTVSPGVASYFDVTITNAYVIATNTYVTGPGQGYNLYDGDWIGWCVDQYIGIGGPTHQVNFYSSLDPYVYNTLAPGHDGNTPDGAGGITPWDCINYIINHKGVHDKDSIQLAIWYYVDGGLYPIAANYVGEGYTAAEFSDAQSIIAEVEANVANWLAEGFPRSVTGYNMVAVVCYVDDDTQLIFIEVDP